MPVYNSDVAEIFGEIADLLEIEGANQFRVRAYRNAARVITTLSRNVADMVEEGKDLSELEGIGEDLAGKIEEIVKTGTLEQLQEIKQRTPPELADMLDIAGLGPKRILAHPTGRRIQERRPYEVDMERLLEGALERGCFLEVNAQPDRLDLDDVYCKMAKEIGLKLSVSTDAHRPVGLEYMRFGVGQARRGWLEPDDVLNTRSWKDLKELLKR